MNPVSASTAATRSDSTREPGAISSDVASLFAAIFAATAAAAAPVQPTPIKIPAVSTAAVDTLDLAATSCAVGEIPQAPPGGWPGGSSSGLPAFPAFTAQGRPRHELPALADALANLASARRDSEVASESSAAQAELVPEAANPPTAALDLPVVPAPSPLVMAASTGISAKAKGAVAPQSTEGEPLLARAAREGGAPVAIALPAANPDKAEAQSRHRKGQADAGTADGAAAGLSGDPQVPAVPTAPPASALAAGVTPHARIAEAPTPQVTAAAAPADVPAERAPVASLTHATVAFDTGDGQEGRLRVSLRGNTLSATLQLPDAATALRLEQDAGGLKRALRAQGFEEARLVIDSPRAAGTAQRGGDETSSRDHKHPREGQPQTGERNTRRERGTSRNER